MKILHINSYYFSGKFYKNFYELQSKNVERINVYVPTSTSNILNYDYGNYTIIDKCYNKIDRYIFHLKHKKIFDNIQKHYKIGAFDIIHAHSLFSNGYIAFKLFQKYNIPYIVAVRNTDYLVFFKKMIYLRPLGIKILKNASKIIFISPANKNLVISNFISKNDVAEIENKSIVIPNGVDNFWLNNIYMKTNFINNQNIRLIQVGDIDKNKNVITTVSAINFLNMNGYDIKLSLVGKIINKKIFSQIENNKNVLYLGYLTKEELIKVYRANDMFILPSYTETFGLVYIEALTQGLPIIYSKGQGFDGQISESIVGVSINPYSYKSIAEAIIQIINNYHLFTSREHKYLNNFSWDNIMNQYTKIYNQISYNSK